MEFPFGPLRELAVDVAPDLLGVPVRVIRGSSVPPVTTHGIWQPDLIEDKPVGRDFNRQEPRQVMALKRSEFATIARGTLVEAPPKSGGAEVEWQVDGHEKQTDDWHHVILIRKTAV